MPAPVKGGKRDAGALDGPKCHNRDAARREINTPPAGVDPRDPPRPCRGTLLAQGEHMRIRQDHKLLLSIRHAGLCGDRARGLHEQRHGAELIEREEACVRRAGLYGERSLELKHIEEVGRRKPIWRRKAKEVQWIRAGLQNRRGRQRWQRHNILDRANGIEQLPPQNMVQLTEDEVVRFINADLARAFVEVAVLQVRDCSRRPSCYLLIQEPGRPAAPVQ